jgi:hypothetical protein
LPINPISKAAAGIIPNRNRRYFRLYAGLSWRKTRTVIMTGLRILMFTGLYILVDRIYIMISKENALGY